MNTREESRRKYLEKRERDLAELRRRQLQAEEELLTVAAEEQLLDASALAAHKRRLDDQASALNQAAKKPRVTADLTGQERLERDKLKAVLDQVADSGSRELADLIINDSIHFVLDKSAATTTATTTTTTTTTNTTQQSSLPIHQYKKEIIEAVSAYPVLILIGETGSGKTTQVPQFLHPHFKGKIAVTQPRRVAAMSVSARVAEEMETRLGELVGYRVRFDQCVHETKTKIEFLTDGMLLKQFAVDPLLSEYAVVMVDEAHERSVATDLILALLKEVLRVRPEFRVVVASATINASLFSNYFNQAPVFNVPGRRFPVEVFYTKTTENDYVAAAALVVLQIHLVAGLAAGDVLVFLPGEAEILDCISIIDQKFRQLHTAATTSTTTSTHATTTQGTTAPFLDLMILPMYGSLSQEQQSAVFQSTPRRTRKIIISSNIAETSITVPGIVYVVDSGMVRQNHYSALSGVEELQTVRVSRASADQRTGRAGRNQPGKCYRLYTRNAYTEMEGETSPEILRCDLSQVLLQLKGIGIHDVLNFNWIQRPEILTLQRALKELFALGLLGKGGQLTAVGKLVEALPVGVKYGRSVVEAGKLGVLEDVVEVVSLLNVGAGLFFSRRSGGSAGGGGAGSSGAGATGAGASGGGRGGGSAGILEAKRMFYSTEGDAMMLREIFRQWGTSGYSSVWCREHGLQFKALKRAKDIKNQLLGICARLPIVNVTTAADDSTSPAETVSEKMTRALCSGFFMNSARLSRGCYTMFGSSEVVDIHPDSCLHRTGTKCILFTELVLTSRLFARTVLKVKTEWLLEAGGKSFKKFLTPDSNQQPDPQDAL